MAAPIKLTLQSLGFEAHAINQLKVIFNGGSYDCAFVDNCGRIWCGELFVNGDIEFVRLENKVGDTLDVYSSDVF